MREEGYYWVKFGSDWEIDEWINGHWINNVNCFNEVATEIDERRIERADVTPIANTTEIPKNRIIDFSVDSGDVWVEDKTE